MTNGKLEGNTLNVYTYVVKASKPVGIREVMRGAKLSSPSVAQRHLQKLEALGLLEKNAYGDYILKEKTSLSGHVWIGKNLVPRLILYSLFFMGAFSTEITIIMFGYLFGSVHIEVSFIALTGITAAAMLLFLIEGIQLRRKLNSKHVKHCENNKN